MSKDYTFWRTFFGYTEDKRKMTGDDYFYGKYPPYRRRMTDEEWHEFVADFHRSKWFLLGPIVVPSVLLALVWIWEKVSAFDNTTNYLYGG